jgi:FdhE protein
MSTAIIRDGSLAGNVPDIPAFRPTSPDVFAGRAARLETLARGHAMEGYLRFAAALTQAQHDALRSFPDVPVPEAKALAHCREHGLPPLSVDGHARHPAWRDGLRRILVGLNRAVLPSAAVGTLASLQQADESRLETAASHLLAGAYAELDAGEAPFIAAALQVYWSKMALTLGADGFSREVSYGLCPVCGSHPVASVVRIGGAAQGLRYLVCSLCASEWHVVRVKCSACASTKGIAYLGIEGATQAIKAETCDECKTYLKIFYQEKDPAIDPLADDLATLALDLLVDEQGYNRVGPNLLILPGQS